MPDRANPLALAPDRQRAGTEQDPVAGKAGNEVAAPSQQAEEWQRAKRGHERAFEQFYNGVHMVQVCETPGFVRGRRFVTVYGDGLPVRPEGEWLSNLAIYDIESDDVARSYRAMLSRQLTYRDVFSETEPYRARLFEQVFETRR